VIRIEKILLVIISVFGFYFCLHFGYILTNDNHIGVLFGIPFALVLTTLCLFTMFTKNNLKVNFRIWTYGYITTLIIYVSIILLIKTRTHQNANQYLYYPEHNSFTILKQTFIVCASLIFLITYFRKR
jgi:hypothetical protein